MASPQKENGNTPIANEIMEALSKVSISIYEMRVILAILRKTYGWHKKEDWISLSQLSQLTNIMPQHISRTLKKLLQKNMIKKNNKKLSFNKDYEQWILPKQVLPKQVWGITQTGNKNLPKQVITKEKKETIQKKGDFSSFKGTNTKTKSRHPNLRGLKPIVKVNDKCIINEQGFLQRTDRICKR